MSDQLARLLAYVPTVPPCRELPPPEDWKGIRTAAGVTQADAADLAEVRLSTWQRWESGRTTPTVTHAFRLRQLFAALDRLAVSS